MRLKSSYLKTSFDYLLDGLEQCDLLSRTLKEEVVPAPLKKTHVVVTLETVFKQKFKDVLSVRFERGYKYRGLHETFQFHYWCFSDV